jgi:ABC-type transport system involved in multi-copper enzyme maturation permease subunit
MKTKELLEARWKLITFALLALLGVASNIAAYSFDKATIADSNVPSVLRHLLVPEYPASTFNAFVWGHWFAANGLFILGLFATILGGGLIANEVSKGTIFFLLSKPVSRERILLTKYGVSAGLLLAVSLMSSIVLAIICIILGHPQDLLHLLVATGLLWLAVLFPLGLSLFFSIVSPDSLRPVIFSLLITVALVLLPAILPNGLDWSLGRYWSSLDAYLAGSFPLKEYLVCLVMALVPLFAALVVFRRKAY